MGWKVKIINGKAPSGGNGGVSDADLQHIAVNLLTKGITNSSHLAVTQQGSPNMSVLVATGIGYVFNSAGTNVYVAESDSNATVNIGSNASGNPRIDAIVLKIDTGVSPDLNASNVASLVAVQGTPAASPSAPSDGTIQTAVGASNAFLRLADVTVANGAASITNANIADKRVPVELRLMTGRLKYNSSSNKLQFSHDGTNYKDVGAGGAIPTFTIIGTLVTGTSLAPVLIAPFALTITKAFARVKTAPTGAALIVDVNKNGTSIWNTNQGNRLQIAASASSGSQTSFDTTSLAEGDYLELDVDQIGSTIAGADLTVELYCQAA